MTIDPSAVTSMLDLFPDPPAPTEPDTRPTEPDTETPAARAERLGLLADPATFAPDQLRAMQAAHASWTHRLLELGIIREGLAAEQAKLAPIDERIRKGTAYCQAADAKLAELKPSILTGGPGQTERLVAVQAAEATATRGRALLAELQAQAESLRAEVKRLEGLLELREEEAEASAVAMYAAEKEIKAASGVAASSFVCTWCWRLVALSAHHARECWGERQANRPGEGRE